MTEDLLGWWGQHEVLLLYLGMGSAALLVVSALAVPVIVANLPADYFAASRAGRPRRFAGKPWLRALLVAGKNTFGGLLLASGILMLFLPGQGILTILCALAIMDFPGKHEIERRIVRYPAVLGAVNWMRHRAGRESFRF